MTFEVNFHSNIIHSCFQTVQYPLNDRLLPDLEYSLLDSSFVRLRCSTRDAVIKSWLTHIESKWNDSPTLSANNNRVIEYVIPIQLGIGWFGQESNGSGFFNPLERLSIFMTTIYFIFVVIYKTNYKGNLGCKIWLGWVNQK